MGFKLVRIDSQDACKVPLRTGTHFIGRGKFLDCDDKRVSRNHGELVVNDDSVTIKALHQNPIFFTKKVTQKDTELLRLGDIKELYNGDKFGLLPDTYWYELIYCINEESTCNEQAVNVANNEVDKTDINEDVDSKPGSPSLLTEDQTNLDIDQSQQQNSGSPLTIATNEQEKQPGDKSPIKRSHSNSESDSDVAKKVKVEPSSPKPCSQSTLPLDQSNEQMDQQETISGAGNKVKSEPSSPNTCSQSTLPFDQSNEQTGQGTSDVGNVKTEPTSANSQSTIPDQTNQPGIPQSSQSDQNSDAKVKDEPDMKQDPDVVQAGPSNDTDASDNGPKSPPSPAKPRAAPLRERCMYGANCYRKNPQHKAQFSHPQDADWGAGALAACPWGALCRRRDPRHWRDHSHPPHVAPPAPHNPPQGKKRRQKKKRRSSDEDTPADDLIVTGKRARKAVVQGDVVSYSDSESNYDPYGTDESDEWQPSGNTDSQLYSQDD